MTRITASLLALAPLILLGGCEIGTKTVEQVGPRGSGTDLVVHKATTPKVAAVPPPPFELTIDPAGQKASQAYQNVQVLGDLSADEFNYTMAALTNWVSPDDGTLKNGGCNYCHNPENMASDELYTKVVARKMLQMTRAINSQWRPHFAASANGGNAGVTCWTCHRGQPVPAYRWSAAPDDAATLKGKKFGQNTPGMTTAAYSSLPYDPFSSYIADKQEIRVQGPKALPRGHVASIADTEKTYGLMMHFSNALNVNCNYCHNSQNFANWSQSRPQRVSAWYGIRMVRDINNNYISALGDVWPANRRGPHGDPYKVNCLSCHQQNNKPLGGYPMLKDYPGLKGPAAQTMVQAVATTQPAAAPTAEPGAAPAAATPPA
ncbi:photosynthetic reaction center cytochrome C subunit [alpha proteobacterium AAP81b]|nr:photosynthetic reaction center cytochrome C subunit [alpha proteobacterium AAP81b]